MVARIVRAFSIIVVSWFLDCFYPKIPQHHLKVILRCEASVAQITVDFTPVLDASVIEQAQILRDDKWNDARLQTLPKQQQSPDTTVAVLERMDAL